VKHEEEEVKTIFFTKPVVSATMGLYDPEHTENDANAIKAEWLAQYLMGIIVPVLRKLSNKPISFSYLFFDLDSKTYKDSFMTR
jgi:hypothetical protein